MPVIEKSITIQAPPDRVFAILDDPASIRRYGPGVTDVSDVLLSEGRIGDSFKVTYSVVGLRLPMTFTIIEHAVESRLGCQVEGSMEGTLSWRLDPDGDSTLLWLYIDYRMRLGPGGAVTGGFLVDRMNDKNAETMLQNIKALAEGPDNPS